MLTKWVTARCDTEVVSDRDIALARDKERLWRENRILKEEREIPEIPFRAAARQCAGLTACAMRCLRGSCRWLIGGLDPAKNRGT